jgi:flavin-dependent dehydrogenase
VSHPIVVIGGGPAGSTCARQLARLGHEVLLAERSTDPRPRLGETSGPRTYRLLEQVCDLSPPPATYRPLTTFFSAWGSEQLDGRSLAFWQAGHGLVLDRRAFDEWLLSSAEAAGVTVLRGCAILDGCWSSDGWMLHGMMDGREQRFAASFVVEATGRMTRSVVHPDVQRFLTDTLVCLSVELPEGLSEDLSATVESCAFGWWYTVQPPNGRQIVALFTDADLVEPAETRLEWFKAILNATIHIRRLAHQFPEDGMVHVCDARTSIRSVLWRDTWICIGDAAWCLDPLSGAGIERAIRNGIDVAAVVSNAVTSGDFGELRSHAVQRADAFREALWLQRRYYDIETRWSEAVFWRRRRLG